MDKNQDIKQINNRPPWIITGKTMSNECFKLTMDMIDKQPPKKIHVYKKINIKNIKN